MNDIQTKKTNNSIAKKSKRNTKSLAIWTSAWLVSLAIVAFGPVLLWDYHQAISLCTIGLNVIMGYKMIMANKQHLEDLDELQQRIHLVAMAMSLGVSIVFGAVYGLLESIRLVEFQPDPSGVLFVMGISYAVSMILAHRKYS
nr:hypothetical protein [uncultured Glaciecola sp.]